MRHFHPPIHAAIVAVTVVAGLASYQGVDKLVLAKGGATYGTTSEPGHEPSSSTTSTTPHTSTTKPKSTTSTTLHTSTTEHHETGSTTSTTGHHEPTTSTTVHKETRPSTSTTSSIPTTGHHESTPTTTVPKPPTTTQTQLSLYCVSGFTGGQGAAKCSWSQSNAPNFGHYRLTKELVGTPRQTIFESNDRGTWSYIGFPLQAGAQYSYIIEAYDTAGDLIARGGPFHLTCCGGGGTT
jgi:hypothetical protein